VVPEVFHVATLFFHVYFVPVVPRGTFLFVRRRGAMDAVRIEFSWKSALLAWSRSAALIATLIGLLVIVLAIEGRGPLRRKPLQTPAIETAGAALVFATLMLYPRRRLPPYKRACDLAQQAPLNDAQWAAMNVQYGRHVHERSADSVLTVR
jgi:hypothetical protein